MGDTTGPILLVDRDTRVLESLRRVLEPRGCQVLSAADGPPSRRPCAVIMEIESVPDPLGALRRRRRDAKMQGVPLLLTTSSHGTPGVRDLVLGRFGAAGFFVKPLDAIAIRDVLDNLGVLPPLATDREVLPRVGRLRREATLGQILFLALDRGHDGHLRIRRGNAERILELHGGIPGSLSTRTNRIGPGDRPDPRVLELFHWSEADYALEESPGKTPGDAVVAYRVLVEGIRGMVSPSDLQAGWNERFRSPVSATPWLRPHVNGLLGAGLSPTLLGALHEGSIQMDVLFSRAQPRGMDVLVDLAVLEELRLAFVGDEAPRRIALDTAGALDLGGVPSHLRPRVEALLSRVPYLDDIHGLTGVPHDMSPHAAALQHEAFHRKFEPDSLLEQLPPGHIRDDVRRVLERADAAFDTLSLPGRGTVPSATEERAIANIFDARAPGSLTRTVDPLRQAVLAEALFRKGCEQLRAGSLAEATDSLSRAIQSEPAEADYLAWAGWAFFATSRERAQGAIAEALRIDPTLQEGRYFHGHMLLEMGRGAEGAAILEALYASTDPSALEQRLAPVRRIVVEARSRRHGR